MLLKACCSPASRSWISGVRGWRGRSAVGVSSDPFLGAVWLMVRGLHFTTG